MYIATFEKLKIKNQTTESHHLLLTTDDKSKCLNKKPASHGKWLLQIIGIKDKKENER